MELKIHRFFLGEDYTIGKLYINEVYLCNTLEDKVRDFNKDGDLNDLGEAKVYGQTAIPFGKYEVILTMSPKFKRELPLLLNVPHFEGIRIHSANTSEELEGCIAPGENKQKGKVLNSRFYESKITQLIKDSINKGESVYINIV